jgi:hypothetical protein
MATVAFKDVKSTFFTYPSYVSVEMCRLSKNAFESFGVFTKSLESSDLELSELWRVR